MDNDTDKELYKCPNAHAEFTYSPSTPEVGELVQFDASPSSGGKGERIISYYWDFGDTNTSYLEKPVHRYYKPGTYTVKLIVENRCGSKSVRTRKLTVVKKGAGRAPTPTPAPTRTPTPRPTPTPTPTPCPTPRASFTYTPSMPYTGDRVYFSSYGSSGGDSHSIIRYEWDFGDGTSRVYGSSVSHVYRTSGTVYVTLKVVNDCGRSATVRRRLTIKREVTSTPTPKPTPGPVTLKCLEERYSCESTGADYPPYTRCKYNVKLKLPRTLHTDIVEFDAKIHCFYERGTGGGEKEKVLHITEALVNYSDTLTLYRSDREFYPDYDFARATRAYMEWGAQTITDGKVTLTIEAGRTPGVTKKTPTPKPGPTRTPSPVPSTGAKTRLVVDSVPSGAEIYIDGKRTGKRTPAVVEID